MPCAQLVYDVMINITKNIGKSRVLFGSYDFVKYFLCPWVTLQVASWVCQKKQFEILGY